MEKVIVYHGTTLQRAHSILEGGKICRTTNEIARYEDTKNGFVYVTKNLCDAMDFSTRPKIGEEVLTFVVFKIDILKNELLFDEDEARWCSTLTGNGAQECYKVNRDLIIGKDVVAVFTKKMKSHELAGMYMSKVQWGEITIDESQWKSLIVQ